MVKGGLKLKRELAPAAIAKPIGEFPVAQVWVDASVYHLDEPFSYLVPGNLSETAVIGAAVIVPFNGRDVSGVVIDRVSSSDQGSLKCIAKVVGRIPSLDSEIIELIKAACSRYASHPFDLIRSAIPDRVVSVEKEFEQLAKNQTHLSSSHRENRALERRYLQLPPVEDRSQLMAKRISQIAEQGGVLAVLPDSREVERLSSALQQLGIDHSVIDSSMSKSMQYQHFLAARLGRVSVVIGTRSAIFAPVINLSSILIYNEGSEHFYEKRSPGWNVRDIALIRARLSSLNLYFVGYSPSSEVARLIEEDWFTFLPVKSRLNLTVCTQPFGELLPSRAISPIKSALKSGPVLFIVPQKGYAQAIRCSKCKTISHCPCGGTLEKLSSVATISCHHCLTLFPQWKCSWCHHEVPALVSRGVERHQQEIAALFPSIPTRISTADHPIMESDPVGLFLATPGMAPFIDGGYSAVVILEGNRFLNQPDLRSQERVREMYFSCASFLRKSGSMILIQDEGHSIATALTTWNPRISLQRELQERRELNLPPYVRTAALTLESGDITRLKSALVAAQDDARLPGSMKILGPIVRGEHSTLILTVDVAHGDEFISTIHEFMKRRSAGKRKLPILRIDPYSLSS